MSAELITPDNDSDIKGSFVAVVLEPLPEDAPEWAHVIERNQRAIASGVNQTNAAIGRILDIADGVKDQVGPLIDSLSSSPMIRMMTGGKR